MSKENCTPASMAHRPEDHVKGEQPHAHSYPGKKVKTEKVTDASHDAAALNKGRELSLGTSADGSTKGLPVSYEFVGHKEGAAPKAAKSVNVRDVAHTAKHDAGALAKGRELSMGTSANGSHKGLPAEYPLVGAGHAGTK